MHIPKIPLTKTNAILFGVAASQVGVVVGAVTMRHILKKKFQADFDERLDAEVEKVKVFYKALSVKSQKYPTPQDRVQELQVFHEAVVAMREYTPAAEIPEEPEISDEERRNIFEENQDQEEGEDAYAREVESRYTEAPYIISELDFRVNEPEHEQNMLTYYADRVLADENDEIVLLIEKTIGVENLERFGHFSENLEIVYVRNEELKTDFEIHRDQTEYRVTVLGKDPAPRRPIRVVPNPPVLSARERFEKSRGQALGSTG